MGLMGGFRWMKKGCASWLVNDVSDWIISPVMRVYTESKIVKAGVPYRKPCSSRRSYVDSRIWYNGALHPTGFFPVAFTANSIQ